MRVPFEKLVRALEAEPDLTKTLGQLALEHQVSVERISDALDTIKMLAGQPTYIEVRKSETGETLIRTWVEPLPPL